MLRVAFLFTAACHLADAYTKSITVQRALGSNSGPLDDDKSSVSCPTSTPTMTSCGIMSSDHDIDGSFISNSGMCRAGNAGNADGVVAAVMCTDSSITCTYPGPENESGTADDASATSTCSNTNELMVSCSGFSVGSPGKALDGAYIHNNIDIDPITSSHKCVAKADGTGGVVRAYGVCCRYTGSEGYELQCKTKFGPDASYGDTSTIGCTGTDYKVMACGGYSVYKDSVVSWYYDPSSGTCKAEFEKGDGMAWATCCRLYRDFTPSPTPKPTPSPTPKPTPSPTPKPTPSPTRQPTPSPTRSPSRPPSRAPTPSPTTNPTSDPTAGPTSDPTAGPTRDPTADPTSDPTAGPTSDPTAGPTRDPTADPTSGPTSDPTGDPTSGPTSDPTASPTTPAPTQPGELQCGARKTGTFTAGEALQIQARMLFQGDMRIDATLSDFVFDEIEAIDSTDPTKTVLAKMTEQGSTNSLTLFDVQWNDDFEFTLTGAASGTFDVSIVCESDAPTSSPTDDPTADPTGSPSADPTADPTRDPSADPTVDPTADPTADPTTDPTRDPTADPTRDPSADPTTEPTVEPTLEPTAEPSTDPSAEPTLEPTMEPTTDPTEAPTTDPTQQPTQQPITSAPMRQPTRQPTSDSDEKRNSTTTADRQEEDGDDADDVEGDSEDEDAEEEGEGEVTAQAQSLDDDAIWDWNVVVVIALCVLCCVGLGVCCWCLPKAKNHKRDRAMMSTMVHIDASSPTAASVPDSLEEAFSIEMYGEQGQTADVDNEDMYGEHGQTDNGDPGMAADSAIGKGDEQEQEKTGRKMIKTANAVKKLMDELIEMEMDIESEEEISGKVRGGDEEEIIFEQGAPGVEATVGGNTKGADDV